MKKLTAEIIFEKETLTFSNEILSASLGALDRGNVTSLIDYGIYANNGNLSIIDKNNTLKLAFDEADDRSIVKVRIWLGDKKTCVATYNIENVYINDETKQVDIDLISPLLEWQNKKLNRSIFVENDMLFYTKSLLELVNFVSQKFGVELSIETTRLANTFVYCPDIDENISVWDFMTQICQVGMCRIFDNEYGMASIFDTTPVKSNIVINPNNIININMRGDKASISNCTLDSNNIEKKTDSILDSETESFNVFEDATTKIGENDSGIEISKGTVSNEIDEDVHVWVTCVKKFNRSIFKLNKIYLTDASWGYIVMNNTYYYSYTQSILHNTNMTYSLSNDKKSVTVNFKIPNARHTETRNDVKELHYILSGKIKFEVDYYEDNGIVQSNYKTTDAKQEVFQTNKLMQTNNTYSVDVIDESLSTEILNVVKQRYSLPINTIDAECLLGEYKDFNGNVALSKNQLFQKYTTVIPYVIRNGKRKPYSVDINGNPSSYEIVGVEYSYQGIFRQKLYLQEVR